MQTFQIIQTTTHCQRKGGLKGDEARTDSMAVNLHHPVFLTAALWPVPYFSPSDHEREEINRN